MTDSIIVDQQGTKLAYTDSGPPSGAYTTVFAVHAMGFTACIFEHIQACAMTANVRFVAITRRNYHGSSPFTDAEHQTITSGSEEEKTAFTINRGVELLTFIDKFMVSKGVPLQVPQSGKPGGIAIIGWSLGNTVTLSAIANLSSVDPDVRARLAPLIHTIIVHEPSRTTLGHAPDPKRWLPWNIVDKTIPENVQTRFFLWWVSSYFKHGDLSKRSHDELENHVPAFNRPPTVYNFTPADRLSILESGAPAQCDIPYLIFFSAQHRASYDALFSKERRKLLPNMQAFFIGGEFAPSFGPSAAWMVEDHDKEHGGGFIKAKLLPGANHFCVYDDPEITLQAYQDCITRTF